MKAMAQAMALRPLGCSMLLLSAATHAQGIAADAWMLAPATACKEARGGWRGEGDDTFTPTVVETIDGRAR